MSEALDSVHTRRHSHADHTTVTRSRSCSLAAHVSRSLTSYSRPSLASLYLSLSPCGTWKKSSNSTTRHSEVRQSRLSIMMNQAGTQMGYAHERTRTRPTDDVTRVALVQRIAHTCCGWVPHVVLGHICACRGKHHASATTGAVRLGVTDIYTVGRFTWTRSAHVFDLSRRTCHAGRAGERPREGPARCSSRVLVIQKWVVFLSEKNMRSTVTALFCTQVIAFDRGYVV
jgi:hypothetical protein